MSLRGTSKRARASGTFSTKCNMPAFRKKLRETRATRPTDKKLHPLHRHLIKLAIDSAIHGACKRAGRELKKARDIAKKY